MPEFPHPLPSLPRIILVTESMMGGILRTSLLLSTPEMFDASLLGTPHVPSPGVSSPSPGVSSRRRLTLVLHLLPLPPLPTHPPLLSPLSTKRHHDQPHPPSAKARQSAPVIRLRHPPLRHLPPPPTRTPLLPQVPVAQSSRKVLRPLILRQGRLCPTLWDPYVPRGAWVCPLR